MPRRHLGDSLNFRSPDPKLRVNGTLGAESSQRLAIFGKFVIKNNAF